MKDPVCKDIYSLSKTIIYLILEHLPFVEKLFRAMSVLLSDC